MRVGIDYQAARTHAPGVGRYARELVRAVVARHGSPELRLLEFGRAEPVMAEASLGLGLARARFRRRAIPLPRRALRGLGKVGLGADRLLGGVDLFHQIHLELAPVSSARQMLTLSELPADGSFAANRLADDLRRLDGVLLFSNHYRERLEREYGFDSARAHVVPVGCDHWRRELSGPVRPVDPPRVLVLGAVRPERGQRVILAACERLRTRGVEVTLRLAGRRAPGDDPEFAAALAGCGAERQGWFEWSLPREDELPKLVAESSVLVHLTEDEGTAVTPLEAFAVGTAVVVSRIPAFEESLGEQVRYVEPGEEGDPDRLADRIEDALARDLSVESSEARVRLAAGFTWDANAAATIEVWRSP